MKPIIFPEANGSLGKPPSMTDEECATLPVFRDGRNCISCWELTQEELALLQKTGKIYLTVVSGKTQPPVSLQVESPFGETPVPSDQDNQPKPDPVEGEWSVMKIGQIYMVDNNNGRFYACNTIEEADEVKDALNKHTALSAQVKRLEGENAEMRDARAKDLETVNNLEQATMEMSIEKELSDKTIQSLRSELDEARREWTVLVDASNNYLIKINELTAHLAAAKDGIGAGEWDQFRNWMNCATEYKFTRQGQFAHFEREEIYPASQIFNEYRTFRNRDKTEKK